MNVSLLIISDNELEKFNYSRLLKILFERGFDVSMILSVSKNFDFTETLNFLKKDVNAIFVCGSIDVFMTNLKERYDIVDDINVFELNDLFYAIMPKYDENALTETIIPTLNSKSRTFYTTTIFKTYGKTSDELKSVLKEYVKNKNRIVFRFVESLDECEVQIKYSSKTDKAGVDAIIANVGEKLKDCVYAVSDVELAEQVARLLIYQGKTLSLAESFTGGGIASCLVKTPGISASLKEGIVCYSNESKIRRLNVDFNIIKTNGAVSIETIYEMAANQLVITKTDYVIATSGNAGPTSEHDDENGLCFVAVGDIHGIHIYKYNFTGSREDVIQKGIKAALFKLYKKLTESEFNSSIEKDGASETEGQKGSAL